MDNPELTLIRHAVQSGLIDVREGLEKAWLASRKAALEEAAQLARGYAPGAGYAILALISE